MPDQPSLPARIVSHLEAHGQTGTLPLAKTLQVGVSLVQDALDTLRSEGRIRHTEGGYRLVQFQYDQALVLEDKQDTILQYLRGRKDTARGTARALLLPRERVEASLEALREQGHLSASVVGNLLVYGAAR